VQIGDNGRVLRAESKEWATCRGCNDLSTEDGTTFIEGQIKLQRLETVESKGIDLKGTSQEGTKATEEKSRK
jgi:hypothetical protein